ncbi:MAG: MarR family winged helix-turn-helix transcriptional regulator [Sphingorhabdus sp.]
MIGLAHVGAKSQYGKKTALLKCREHDEEMSFLADPTEHSYRDSSVERNIETRVWLGVLAVHGDIFNRLNRAFSKEFGITLAKFDVLAQLARFEEGLTQGVLSHYLKVTGGNVTGLVRRLATDGMITREMSATDRRAFIVRLTPKGATIYTKARKRHDALLQEWFAGVPDDDMRSALHSLSALTRHFGSPAARARHD